MNKVIKRLLKKYHYPQEAVPYALETVFKQCEQWTDNDKLLHGLTHHMLIMAILRLQKIDLSEVHRQLVATEKKIESTRQKHNELLKELGLPLI